MTIYLDAIFVLNLLFNFLILLLVQSIVRHDTKKRRICFGAFIATLLVPLTLYFPQSFFTTVGGKGLYSLLIITTAYRYQSFKKFVTLLFTFYFISFGIGGGLLALHFMLNESFTINEAGILTYRTGFGHVITWIFLLITFPIVFLFTHFRMKAHIIDQIRYDAIYDVHIKIDGKKYETSGFIDSGNQLIDPITKTPVIICDDVFFKNVFTNGDWEALKYAYDSLNVDLIPQDWKSKLFVVPFKGVEGSSHFLFTIKLDSIVVYLEEQTLVSENVLIGIQFSSLTDEHRYHCLLNPTLIHTATIQSA